jgi:hypothetical protein
MFALIIVITLRAIVGPVLTYERLLRPVLRENIFGESLTRTIQRSSRRFNRDTREL